MMASLAVVGEALNEGLHAFTGSVEGGEGKEQRREEKGK
jgi:hypothetical protein